MSSDIQNEDTLLLFENISKGLQDRFGHNPDRARELIQQFRGEREYAPREEGGWTFLEWIHHDGDHEMASFIQFYFALAPPNAKRMDYINWKAELRRVEDEKWREFLEARKQQS